MRRPKAECAVHPCACQASHPGTAPTLTRQHAPLNLLLSPFNEPQHIRQPVRVDQEMRRAEDKVQRSRVGSREEQIVRCDAHGVGPSHGSIFLASPSPPSGTDRAETRGRLVFRRPRGTQSATPVARRSPSEPGWPCRPRPGRRRSQAALALRQKGAGTTPMRQDASGLAGAPSVTGVSSTLTAG